MAVCSPFTGAKYEYIKDYLRSNNLFKVQLQQLAVFSLVTIQILVFRSPELPRPIRGLVGERAQNIFVLI